MSFIKLYRAISWTPHAMAISPVLGDQAETKFNDYTTIIESALEGG